MTVVSVALGRFLRERATTSSRSCGTSAPRSPRAGYLGALTRGESMAHDLVIRNGQVVDGTGAEPINADVAIDGDRITAVGDVDGARQPRARRRRPARHPRLRRHPHPPRRAARLGPDRVVVVLARRHLGGARQLRRDVRARASRRTARPRRDDGVGRGHPGGLDHGRPRLGLGVLRRVPGRGRPDAEGRQRGRDGRALRDPHPRHGRACARRGAGDRRRRRPRCASSSPRRSTRARSASPPRAPRCTGCPTVASCPARTRTRTSCSRSQR